MNQDALLLIFEGYDQRAKETLHECLDKAVQRAKGSAFPGSSRSSLSVSCIPLIGSLGPEDDWQGYGGQYFQLYRYLFNLTETGVHLWDSVTYFSFAGMVGYNVAMIYHHEGLLQDDLSSLLTARVWYEYSINMLARGRDTSDQGTILLRLSLYNNLGHVCSLLGDGPGVRRCRKDMQTNLLGAHPVDAATLGIFHRGLSLAWAHP